MHSKYIIEKDTGLYKQKRYKKRASQLINAESPNATSVNGSVVALENTIPQESSSVKENIPDTQNQARVTKEQDSAYMEAVKNGDTSLLDDESTVGCCTILIDLVHMHF